MMGSYKTLAIHLHIRKITQVSLQGRKIHAFAWFAYQNYAPGKHLAKYLKCLRFSNS